jgi:integrase
MREHLTESEMEKVLAVLKQNKHGHRDWLIGLLIYRHGLRVCKLRWDDIDLTKRTIAVHRLKGTTLEAQAARAVGAKSSPAYAVVA